MALRAAAAAATASARPLPAALSLCFALDEFKIDQPLLFRIQSPLFAVSGFLI
jgi:hypothetical protein